MKKLALSAAVLIAAISTATMAQPVEKLAPSEEITVIAPYYVHQKAVKNDIRSLLQAVSIEKRVSYADLDLRKPADADKFRARISDAATSLCKQLDLLYPPIAYVPLSTQDCVKTAADRAMFSANIIIDFWRS